MAPPTMPCWPATHTSLLVRSKSIILGANSVAFDALYLAARSLNGWSSSVFGSHADHSSYTYERCADNFATHDFVSRPHSHSTGDLASQTQRRTEHHWRTCAKHGPTVGRPAAAIGSNYFAGRWDVNGPRFCTAKPMRCCSPGIHLERASPARFIASHHYVATTESSEGAAGRRGY